MVNDAVARQELWDVVLHVFLNLRRQIAQAQVALLVVPGDDFRAGTFLRVLANPSGNLVVRRAGGHEGAEGVVVNAGEFEPDLIERAVGVVFAPGAGENGPAFVHGPGGQHVAGVGVARAARELFAVPQIAGEQFDSFQVLFVGFHKSSFVRTA